MIGRFRAAVDGYRADLDEGDNLLLQQLVREILVVLDEPGDLTAFVQAATGFEASRAEPRDPALTNLLPPMSDDAPQAAELRALTEDFLRAEKSARLRSMAATLQTVQASVPGTLLVARDDVWDWLAALNDIRLALAGELGIRSDADAERVMAVARGVGTAVAAAEPGDPPGARRWGTAPPSSATASAPAAPTPRERAVSTTYLVVTWWQDSLLRAVRGGAPAH